MRPLSSQRETSRLGNLHHWQLRMAIMSAYATVNVSEGKQTQVLDMVFSFSYQLWILLTVVYGFLFGLMLLGSSIRSRYKRKRASRTAAAAVIACILKQHSSSGFKRINNLRMMYLATTILSFFAAFYLTSMIKTDMLLIKPPLTIRSYDDIIRTRIRPLWVSALRDKEVFENSAPGSKQAVIWDLASQLGLRQSLVHPETFITDFTRVAMQEASLLFRCRVAERVIRWVTCEVSRTKGIFTNMNILTSNDETASESLRGYVRNHLLNHKTAKRINLKIQKSFEADLMQKSITFYDVSAIMPVQESEKQFRAIDECSNNVITIPNPETRLADKYHYVSLFVLFFVSVVISVTAFLIELTSSVCRRCRKVAPAPIHQVKCRRA